MCGWGFKADLRAAGGAKLESEVGPGLWHNRRFKPIEEGCFIQAQSEFGSFGEQICLHKGAESA